MEYKNPTQDLLDKYRIKPPVCGARVGRGWLPLLERLIVDLIALKWNRDCHQIKEKFGGLRFYVGRTSEKVRDRILKAECESYAVCEECGAPGKNRDDGGWLATECMPCHRKRVKRYAKSTK